jgi:chromosome condensin MukBEF complex kleisin-like MukF subunit
MRIHDRILLVGLGIIDRLFATSFLEREVARRKAKVARSEARLAEISEQLLKLGELLEAANLQLCLLYLRQRNLLSPQRWLHFDSVNLQEDQGLDLLINHLVKPRLAAIEMQEVEKNHYIYRLKPDWAAIGDFLVQQEADLQPEIADWLKTLKKVQKPGF